MLSKFKSNAGISWGTYKTISLQRSRKTWLYERDITWYYIEQMVPYHCPSLRWRKRIIAGGDKKTRLRSKNARARERRPLKQLFFQATKGPLLLKWHPPPVHFWWLLRAPKGLFSTLESLWLSPTTFFLSVFGDLKAGLKFTFIHSARVLGTWKWLSMQTVPNLH